MNNNLNKLKLLLNVTKLFAFFLSFLEFAIFGACIIYLIRMPDISETELTIIYSLLSCDETTLSLALLTTLITAAINFICLYLGYYWLKQFIKNDDLFDNKKANNLKILSILTIVMFFIHLIIMTIFYVTQQVDALSDIIPLFPIGLVELGASYLLKYGYERINNLKGE